MSSFDNHQHIEEVMADASDAERQELSEWIHGFDIQYLDEEDEEEEDGPEWGNYYEDHCGDYEF